MAYYIDPIETTEAQILAGPAEDPTPAWTPGARAVGDELHVVATHRVYRCAAAGTKTISPEADPNSWQNDRPTQRWAPFDPYTSTAITATADITYTLKSRFTNAVVLYGLQGKTVTLTITANGVVIYSKTVRLQYPARGYWDYGYGQRRSRTSLIFTGLPIHKNAEITVTVAASGTSTRAIGMLIRGKLTALHGRGGFGGTQTEPTVDPRTFTYRKTEADGTYKTTKRGSAKNLSFTVLMDRSQADRCLQELELLLPKPVCWILSLKPGFAGLSAFGWTTKAPLRYRYETAMCDLTVEGNI